MSTKHYHAAFDAGAVTGARVLIVEARFYDGFADALLEGARAVLDEAGVAYEIVTVPGALEIPAVIAAAVAAETAGKAGFDGYVALGTVVRGGTTHYEIVSNESSRGLMTLAIDHALAIGNGILTVENDDQAWERAKPSELDKGGGAAAAALAMIAIRRRFGL
ncbi:MAG: 6,7-dimethyl-8-ribityllumazine synthase [Ancalomicrobiaceae bacterium]|nr:6,7-dimethyl-8-ribityllumazine synthase [Ancalomicrobiaceae bacterium]